VPIGLGLGTPEGRHDVSGADKGGDRNVAEMTWGLRGVEARRRNPSEIRSKNEFIRIMGWIVNPLAERQPAAELPRIAESLLTAFARFDLHARPRFSRSREPLVGRPLAIGRAAAHGTKSLRSSLTEFHHPI